VNVAGQRIHYPPPDLEINGKKYWADQTADKFDEVVARLTRGDPLSPELAALVEAWRPHPAAARETTTG
jgi:hypothetical protein